MLRSLTILAISIVTCAAAQAQHTHDEIHLQATVQSVIPLTSFSGQVMRVDVDPRFALTVHIESVVPAVANFTKGAVVTFAIHSPSLLFAGDEPTMGKTYDFYLGREIEDKNVRFFGLTLYPDWLQFLGKWQTRISRRWGKHLFTLNIEVQEGNLTGTMVLVDPVDGSEIKSEIVNAKSIGNAFEFQTKVMKSAFDWRLTLTKGNKKGLLHGSTGELVIDERVEKER